MTDELPAPEPPQRRARWRNVAICERCWIARNSTWEPHSGSAGMEQLVRVRQPVMVNDPPIEVCWFCLSITILGIYVRSNEEHGVALSGQPVLSEDEWNELQHKADE